MKVISLLEPWASLIKEKVKYIETRSWATKYRGEIYIHASKKKLTKNNFLEYKNILNLLPNTDFKYGFIIAKCKLLDCKYMDDELINEVKKNHNEYICGDYSVGRYAWILEDIEVLEIPIQVKGNLGIWNYYYEDEVMNYMETINYGWIDKYENMHNTVDESFSDNYILQSPEQTTNSKIGVCWDQVELERKMFNKNAEELKTYFICNYDGNNCPSHTFLIYKKGNSYYWFEHSWDKYKGIHKFSSINELLEDVRKKFIETELNNVYNKSILLLREYSKPNYGINVQEFYKHCEKGKVIEL